MSRRPPSAGGSAGTRSGARSITPDPRARRRHAEPERSRSNRGSSRASAPTRAARATRATDELRQRELRRRDDPWWDEDPWDEPISVDVQVGERRERTRRSGAAGRHADDGRGGSGGSGGSGGRSARRARPSAGAPLERRRHESSPRRPPARAARARPELDDRPALKKRAIKVRTRRHHFKAGQSRRRLRALVGITAVVFALILGRVVWLQTRDAEQLREAGRAQRTSETTLEANRGVIFDRNGDELALSVPSTTIFANPKLVTDPQGTVRSLAVALGLDPDKQQSLLEAFTLKEKSFVYVARQVTEEQAQAVDLLDLNGVDSLEEDRRTMPAGSVGQSVIGRTNIDGEGIAGVEMQYDLILTGVDGEMSRQHDRDGRSLPGSETTTVAPVPGQDIVLTIDRSVQYEVEQAMVERVTALGARGGSAVVMDTDTGEIIAMVGVRMGEDGIVRVTSGNIAAVDAAEPGSVVKAITVAAALNEGTVTPDTMFEVPYKKKYSDGELHDAEVHPTYTWPVHQILAKSSNIGTIEVMLTMGQTLRETKEKLGTYMKAFGLGEKTALDFPGESRGLGVDWTKWEGTEQYTVSYGQGIASTSIQLVSAINVIANDGVYVAPKLVSATIDAEGELTETPDSATRRVVRPEVAQQVNYMMRDVVCTGTAKLAQVKGVSVAGKTGTGLKAQDGGGYEDEDGNRKYYSSFAGYFPAEDPQVTVLISIDEPPGDAEQQTRFGGTAAAPVFADIAPTIIHEMNIQLPATGGGCAAG